LKNDFGSCLIAFFRIFFQQLDLIWDAPMLKLERVGNFEFLDDDKKVSLKKKSCVVDIP